MTPDRLVRSVLGAFLLLAAAACGAITETEPEAVPESDLTFVRLGPGAPAIDDTAVSFWAVRGEDRETQIRYVYSGNGGFAKCLRFSVPAGSLLARPDGTPFAPGDSIRITVRMPDPERLTFEFEPSGLRFDPAHPAVLEVVYLYADEDFDGDGVVDSDDREMAARFEFWRQEAPGLPWTPVPTLRDAVLHEAIASITGFTKYALASE